MEAEIVAATYLDMADPEDEAVQLAEVLGELQLTAISGAIDLGGDYATYARGIFTNPAERALVNAVVVCTIEEPNGDIVAAGIQFHTFRGPVGLTGG